MSRLADTIDVLHVDDEQEFAALAAEFLEREDERLVVETATSASEGLDRLSERGFDCVVSDYEMPGRNGIEFLETVREAYPDLPFILFTGKGSEEVASEAISAGVTDYLQKGTGRDQYAVLANRIANAVGRSRAEKRADLWTRAIETANEGIAIIDEDGLFVEMNDAYADLYGTDPADLIGEPWTVTVPEAEVERQREEVFPTLAETEGWSDESVGERVDGSVYPKLLSLASLEDGGHVCVVRDISEQKGRERELRRKAAKLEVLFENSPAMIDIHDADGRLVEVNRRLCEKLGYEEGELIGKRVWEIDRAIDPAEAREMWAEMDTGDLRELEGEYRRRDGSTFPVEVHLARVDLDGTDRFFVISRDVTDRREHRRRLERQNERLAEFASIVSHDLRNPLEVAIGRLDLARADSDSPHLDDLERALERMDELIDDLLALARQGDRVSDLETVSLADVLDACWRTVETADATLSTETDLTIRADRSRLRQLLENLLRNAVEYGATSPPSGAREDSEEPSSSGSRVEPGDSHGSVAPVSQPESSGDSGDAVESGGGDVTITVGDLHEGFYVADDGPGIPESERDEVFESGYSTAEDGTGFGLAIVAEIAEAHGWDVSVTESDGGGARFEITGAEVV